MEKFLVLFNQAWCTDEKFILDLQNIPEEFKDIAKYLQGPVMDDKFRRQLEAEEQLDTIFDGQEAKYLKQIALALNEKEEANKQKVEAEERELEERKQKEEANKQKEILAIKLAGQMKKFGVPLNEIALETGLTQEEIEKL